ncbi:MAG: hypothetical protein WBE76_23385 [Terracidiphilus sp.]
MNRDMEVVRHMLYSAADEGFIPANPIARVRMGRERRTRRPVMPVAEETKLLAACSAHLRSIVTAALDTGRRWGEPLGIQDRSRNGPRGCPQQVATKNLRLDLLGFFDGQKLY